MPTPKRGPSKGQPPVEPWPTVEEQLKAAGAVPGTALDELIRRNQDFSLLKDERPRPDLPPWLRVYWRKAHPDSRGYPLAIRRLHAWLLKNPDHPKLKGSSLEK